MHALVAIFALLVGAVGWYYLFYSHATQRLGGIEEQRANRLRATLRRANAVIMLLMAVGIALGMFRFDHQRTPAEFFITWAAVMLLLVLSILLALIDLRLTIKLRHALRQRRRQ
jgi:hypothetical protein